jgi:hypothetical protein
LHIVSSRIGNPFEDGTHNPNGQEEFAKVGAAAEAAQKAIEVLFKNDNIVGQDNITCQTPMAEMLPQLPSGLKTLTRERNLELGSPKPYKNKPYKDKTYKY